VGALCVAEQAGTLPGLAALLESLRAAAPEMKEVAALAPGEPARMFPPLAPGLAAAELLETRIGFRPVTSDGWPVLGGIADGLFVATGHGAEGLTAGPWSGLAVALLALGQQPPADLAPFSPYRFQS
jgi:D-amino-acid dehydrogenase